jgi:hypothetical protein
MTATALPLRNGPPEGQNPTTQPYSQPSPQTPQPPNAIFQPELAAVMKFGQEIGYHEAMTLMALAKSSFFPVPRVWQFVKDGQTSYLAERIDGMTLESAWPDFTPEQKQFVLGQLQTITQELRRLSPEDVPKSPLIYDRFFWPRTEHSEYKYPTVDIEADFMRQIALTVERTSGVFDPNWTRLLSRLLRRLPTGLGMVFTHGALHPENILVDGNGKIVCITNWAESGFYPVFWEYCKAHVFAWESRFIMEGGLDCVLRPYPAQLAALLLVKDLLW